MRFGIIANMARPGAGKVIERIVRWAADHDVELHFSDSLTDHVGADHSLMPERDLPDQADLIVCLGGDGTMLATARTVGRRGTPILGINLGYLGFLTQLTPTALEETLTAIRANKYQLEKRMVAEVEIDGGPVMEHCCALNDVVIDRGQVSRLINLDLYANDYLTCSYAADGLIISTPTGSTAYSLAVGGPIINPLMKAFIATPISAFALTTRPIIFSDSDKLRVVTRSKHADPVLTLDGQVACNLPRESSLHIRKADYDINFVVFRQNSFYDVLRSKLHWGRLPEGTEGGGA